MKLSEKSILALLACAWIVLEVNFPPIVRTYWSLSWGGRWHTIRSRHGFGGFDGSPGQEVDFMVLCLECALVGLALLAGFTALRGAAETSQSDSELKSIRCMARCAAVLHLSVVALPLCNAGADTVWLLNPFGMMVIGALFLWPNAIALVAALKLSREASSSLSKNSWIPPFVAVVAILWSLFLFVTLMPLFDVKAPLGGAILGTVALWLTALALIRITVKGRVNDS